MRSRDLVAGWAVLGGVVALGAGRPAAAQLLPPIDPAYATPQALLQRDFNYMQATKPGASRRPQLPQPGTPGYRTGYPYGTTRPSPSNYGWTPGYGYFNGYYGYFNPSGVFIVLNGGNNVYQREVYVYREGTTGNPAYPQPGQGNGGTAGDGRAPQGRPATEPEKPRGGDDFYLGNGGRGAQSETITDALDDIRKAWLNGDFNRLKARFKSDGQVKVYPKGQFKYAVPAPDFLGMVKDAMTRLDTVAFEFDRPKSEAAGKVFVSGKHTFLDGEKNRSESYISYGLERVDGKWVITEAGSSSAGSISKHE